MWSYLKPKRGDVFIDIGAHIGKYALQVAKIVGEGGLVIAIEPSPENYHVLVRNVRLNDLRNTVALQIAAWEEKGQLQLFKSRYLTGQSLKRNHGLGSITVKTVSTDDIVDELRIRRVDWIKVDVEGAEYEVMKGLERTLMRFRPVVITEVFDDNRLRILRFMERVQYVATRANPGSEYPSYFLCLPIQLTVRRADSGVAVGFSFKEHARETFTKLRILN
jgi:FkbM family methyltransferase